MHCVTQFIANRLRLVNVAILVRYPAGPRGAARWRRRAAQAVRLPDSQFKTQKLVPRG